MKSLLLMVSFFTRIPVHKIEYSEERYIRGIKYVPLIGLLTGGALYAASFAVSCLDRDVSAIILAAVYILLTGALHIDGMADTCDGLFSGRDRDRVLEIMRDSRNGTYGVISIAFHMVFYVVMFRYIPYEALIVMPVTGKSASIVSAYMANYVRNEGLGKVFAENCGRRELASAIIVPVIVSVFTAPEFLIGAALALASSVGITAWLKKRIGGITGDTMGFVCESAQMVFVFTMYLIGVIQ